MVKGAPDHFKGVALYAWDGAELVLVKVDSSGQLYALLMGDADGTPTPISVTPDGELFAALKAVYDGTLIGVLADASGNLTLNLKAQDLAEIINRPKYGAANVALANMIECSAGEWTPLITVSGRGVIYGGRVNITEAWNDSDFIAMEIDGTELGSTGMSQMWGWGDTYPMPGWFYITRYDKTMPRLHLKIPTGITFETSARIKYYATATDRTVWGQLLYALV